MGLAGGQGARIRRTSIVPEMGFGVWMKGEEKEKEWTHSWCNETQSHWLLVCGASHRLAALIIWYGRAGSELPLPPASFGVPRPRLSLYTFLPKVRIRIYIHIHMYLYSSAAGTRELRELALRYDIYFTSHVPPKLVSLALFTIHRVALVRLSNLASLHYP